jgi:hypothetical protein
VTAAIGLLMLETAFPRPVGDVGNPNSHAFPVLTEVVRGASPARVVGRRPSVGLAPFVAAAHRLVDRGAIGIATSCGFLSLYQGALAASLPVPVAVSSLLQVPMVESVLPAGRRCGVITFDHDALTGEHLAAAGARADTPTVGMPARGALRAMVGEGAPYERDRIAAELVDAGRKLVRHHPEVGAVVLECTNLPPYRQALGRALALPIYDVNTLLGWFWAGLAPSTQCHTSIGR